jgi:hypothetical protein
MKLCLCYPILYSSSLLWGLVVAVNDMLQYMLFRRYCDVHIAGQQSTVQVFVYNRCWATDMTQQ